MTFRSIAEQLAPLLSYIAAQCQSGVDVAIVLRNDSTGDQLVLGTRADGVDLAAFLQRAVKTLRTPETEAAVLVVDRRTGKNVDGGEA